MATPAPVKVACLLLICCMVINNPHAEAALCRKVMASISPCIGYVKKGGMLPVACCGGVKRVHAAAKTTPARQAVCTCVKTIATRVGGVNATLVDSLKKKCHVDIPYTYTPTIDCSKIK